MATVNWQLVVKQELPLWGAAPISRGNEAWMPATVVRTVTVMQTGDGPVKQAVRVRIEGTYMNGNGMPGRRKAGQDYWDAAQYPSWLMTLLRNNPVPQLKQFGLDA